MDVFGRPHADALPPQMVQAPVLHGRERIGRERRDAQRTPVLPRRDETLHHDVLRDRRIGDIGGGETDESLPVGTEEFVEDLDIYFLIVLRHRTLRIPLTNIGKKGQIPHAPEKRARADPETPAGRKARLTPCSRRR